MVMAYNNCGNAYHNKGDYDRAIADYEAVIRIDPDILFTESRLESARRAQGY
jgi:tetratricopeptide (TPR) repeat protein